MPRPGSWAAALGGAGHTTASAILIAADGGAIVGGAFDGEAPFAGGAPAGGSDDAFLARLQPGGAPMWRLTIGGPGAQKVSALTFAPDGAVIAAVAFAGAIELDGARFTARGAPDALIAALDPDTGAVRWARHVTSTAYVRIAGVSVAADGAIALGGLFAGTTRVGDHVVTSAGAGDALAAMLDAGGTVQWAVRGGAAYADAANAVAIDAGGVTITGGFTLRADFSGVALEGSGRHANQDVFVARYRRDGTLAWASRFGSVGHDAGLSLQTDGERLFVGGSFGVTIGFGGGTLTARGNNDAFVAAFGTDGGYLWSMRIGGEGSEDAYRLALDGESVVIAGTFDIDGAFGAADLSTAGLTDVFVARIAADGTHATAWSAGGSAHDAVGGLDARDGAIAVVGSFAESGTFGPTTLEAGGDRSAFVAVVAP